ncbi:MAG: putative lipid II flippase FtsW [Candidatus Dormibacteraeota bacterium]|nr:putative lipid II flippase FtsW [Candidatus Dormibacteraeota bacterium]
MASPATAFERTSGWRVSAGVAGRMFAAADRATAAAGVDGWLLIVVVGLVAFGLVMVYSASEALGYLWYGNPNYFFEHQLVGVGLGAAGMLLAARIDYHRLRRLAKPAMAVMLVALVVVLLPHIGSEHNGAQRWFQFGPLSVQPSAVAVAVAIVFCARWIDDRASKLRSLHGVRDYIVVMVALLGLILAERDLGSTIVIAAVGFVMLALGGALKRHLVLLLAFLGGVGFLLVSLVSYRADRLAHFLNPCADALGSGFQNCQALLALGSGGIGGVGLGNSVLKYEWLPEAHTDFIFAIIGEELGLIGTVAVVAAFLFLAWRGVRASLRAPDQFGALLAGGITAWICVEAFINVGAVTGVIPTTGIPLPFISYGGTALATCLVGVGVLCNISAQGRRQGAAGRAGVDRWRWDGGTPDPGAGRGPGAARRRSRR